jgi:ABC-type glycerol-3-phosphate transport system substrate-binding protein
MKIIQHASTWITGLSVLAVSATCATAALAEDIVIQWQATALTEAQYEPIWRTVVADFEAKYPRIKIEPILVPRKDNWTKFVTAAQAGIAPCIVSVPVPTAAYNGYLMPMDEMWANEPESYKSVWSPESLGVGRFEGSLYGMPFYAGIYGEVYNGALVRAAGLDPTMPPKTWDEYLTWAKALDTADHDATAILAGPTETTTRVLLSWIYSNGGKPFNDDMTESYFSTDSKTVEAIKFYLGLETEYGLTSPGSAALNYAEQTVLFAQGKIGTMRNAYWGLAKVLRDNPEMAADIIVAPPPANDSDARTVATVTTNSISANCEHPQEAWNFLTFLSKPEYAVQMVSAANWMPLRNDLLDMPVVANDPVVQTYLAMGAEAVTIPLSTPAWTQIAGKDIVEAVQQMLQEPDRIDEILAQLDETVTEHLKDN